MKNVKQKLFAVLLACALASLGAGAALADKLSVSLTNKTDAKVFVAIAGVSTGGESSGDFSKGWYAVEPGQSRTIKFREYSPVFEYYFYATSKGGKRVWEAKGGNGESCWIHPKNAFESKGGRKVSGGKKVPFRHLSVGTDGKAKINFVVK